MIYVPAKYYTPADRLLVDLIVLHSTETSRGPNAARKVADYFAAPTNEASAHFVVDDDVVIQGVHKHDIAWAAPGANRRGIQIEMIGHASQSQEAWLDGKILWRTARLVAELCQRYALPRVYVDEEGLFNGLHGITTHATVSKTFRKSNHWDPGKDFPMKIFIDCVQALW